ncbi:MAG: hypothetical protein HQK79_12240 [Desulfobacterales bacterium]|nr:hypothetical protein [Desulfobacterales bacterium]
MRSILLYFLLCTFILVNANELNAVILTEGDLMQVNFSPYIYHYNFNPEHNSYPWCTGLEWESSSRWSAGGNIFSNSYNQICGYLYGGKRFIYGSKDEHLFFKITAGALIGYVEPYEDKIPINKDGIGLGIIPTIGYKYKRTAIGIVILSTSALMLTFSYDIFK